MAYWDTSALVKLYVKEPDSQAFENYALNVTASPIISRIALYEARATFQRKEVEGSLTANSAQRLHDQLLGEIGAGLLPVIEFGRDVEGEYGDVLRLCCQHKPPLWLRTLDAVHLASARVANDYEMVAMDRRLRDAARLLGFTLFPA